MSTPLDWTEPNLTIEVPDTSIPVIDVLSPRGVEILVVQGKDGTGVQLDGAVATYAALPTGLTPADAGSAYVVQATGKLYVWSGTAWPSEANGADFRGQQGNPGRGISDISLAGDALQFAMSDTTTDTVTIPAITAANDSATAAAVSASAAATARTGAEDARTAAQSARDTTTTARDTTLAARDAAAGSATAAATSATNAAGSATAAAGSATTAGTQADTATSAATAALGHMNSANGYATAAAESLLDASNAASASADSAAASATSAGSAATSATNAQTSADAAAQSAADAADTVSSGVPNATTTAKGAIILAGDLAGTYDAPTVPGLANKADLVGGKIPTAQIPAQATNERHVVANTPARLALTSAQVQPGDLAIQVGNPGRGTYILNESDPSTEGSWILLPNPDAPVSSVNGFTGIVVLGKADVGLGDVDNTSDVNKPVSTAQQTALNGKSATGHQHSGADIASGTVAYARLPVGTAASTVAAGNDSRISGAVQTTRTVSTSGGLTGGGDLSANRTLSIATGGVTKAMTETAVQTSLGKADTAVQNKGSATGLFIGALPGTGETGVLYVVP